ncbi:MAG: hypothetical protein CVV27_16410, partial [Candidatus Melainabacteria bacterium HGW-Melainabacteria-1]
MKALSRLTPFKLIAASGLSLSLLLSIAACNQSATPPTSNQNQISSSQNQTVSKTSLRGQMVLPYRINEAQLSASSPLDFFLGAPAHADDLQHILKRSDLDQLRAYVNGELVTLKIVSVSFQGDETLIQYEITEMPMLGSDEVYVLEIRTPDGSPLLGGALTVVPDTVNTFNLSVETTALLDLVREVITAPSTGKPEATPGKPDSANDASRKLGELTSAELESLKLDPSLLNKQASIRSILRKDGTLKKHALDRFVITPTPTPTPDPTPTPTPDPTPTPTPD